MSISNFEKFFNLEFLNRTQLILLAAGKANAVFEKKYPETFGVFQDALSKCNNFIQGIYVDPKELAIYVDGGESDCPYVQENLFKDNPDGMHALVYIVMTIGHVAHYAYVGSDNANEMSGVIAEANEFILGDIFEYGEKYGLSDLVGRIDR